MKQIFLWITVFIHFQTIVGQNLSAWNVTPFRAVLTEPLQIAEDSNYNKFTLGRVGKIYSTPVFFFSGCNQLLIKYNHQNQPVFYKKLLIDHEDSIKQAWLLFDQANIFVVFACTNYFKYDNGSPISANGIVIAKIHPLTGNLISNFQMPNPSSSFRKAFCSGGNIFLSYFNTSNFIYNGYPVGPTNYFSVVNPAGNLMAVKNLPTPITTIQSITKLGNHFFISGYRDSLLTNTGIIQRWDSIFNFINEVRIGVKVPHIVASNNQLFCVAYSEPPQIGVGYKVVISRLSNNLAIQNEVVDGLEVPWVKTWLDETRPNFPVFLSPSAHGVTFAIMYGNSNDSIVGCGITSQSNTSLIIKTLDSNLNCKSSIRVHNLTSWNNNTGLYNNFYNFANFSNGGSGFKQISLGITSAYHSHYTDTPCVVFLNKHPFPLTSMPRGNVDYTGYPYRSPNIISFYSDKWLEAFHANKTKYCVGDELSLDYKKWGTWDTLNVLQIECSPNINFPFASTRLIGSYSDTIAQSGSLQNLTVRVPHISPGWYYIRIKSISPERVSNICDSLIYIYPKPIVNAGADLTVCSGDSAELIGNNNGNSFYWTTFPYGILDDSLSLNPKLLVSGNSIAVLHVTDANGCSNLDTAIISAHPAPLWSFAIDSAFPSCQMNTISVNVSLKNADSLLVDWGDGKDTALYSANNFFNHYYSGFGSKKIRLKGFIEGCLGVDSIFHQVNSPIKIYVSNDTVVCSSSPVPIRISASGLDGNFNYLLRTFAGITSLATGVTQVVALHDTSVVLGVIVHCLSDTIWKTVNIHRPSGLQLKLKNYSSRIIDTLVCENSNVQLEFIAIGGDSNFYKYFQQLPDGSWDSLSHASISAMGDIEKQIHVKVIDNCSNNEDSVLVRIKVHKPVITFPIRDTIICENETLTIKPYLSNGLSFSGIGIEWKSILDNSILSIDTVLTKKFLDSEYIEFILVDSICNRVFKDTFYVEVLPDLVATKVISSDSGCWPLLIQIKPPDINSIATNANAFLFFDAKDGSLPKQISVKSVKNGYTILHNYFVPGTYHAELFYTDLSGSSICSKWSHTFVVKEKPKAQFNFSPQAVFPSPDKVSIINTSSSATNFIWDLGDGTYFQTSSLLPFTHSYTSTGTYHVALKAINASGCLDTATGIIHVKDSFSCFIPNAFTPNADGINDLFVPVISDLQNAFLSIFDRWGTLIYTTDGKFVQWDGNNNSMPVQTGDYFYVMETTGNDKNSRTFSGVVKVIR